MNLGETTSGARPALNDRAVASLLYAMAVLPLSYSLDARPPFLYNWEEYTVWRLMPRLQDPGGALLASLRLNDGLMTDSGLTPALMAPLLFLSLLFGPNLWALRLFPVAFSALAVPLTYLVGVETYGRRAGLLAAVFTATSACFALYARTATNVGISLVPTLFTLWLLLRWQKRPSRLGSVLLGLLFVVEVYYYATIRFLVLLAIPLVALVLWRKRPPHGLFHCVAIFAPILFLIIWLRPASPPVLGSLLAYYKGRGEQIVAMYAQDGWGLVPQELAREPWLSANVDPRLASAVSLIKSNLGNYANLYLSAETSPATLDFWNPHGRLYHPFLTPFFLMGLALALRQWRSVESGTLLLALFGTSLPIVLTNNVHVGRLLLSLPPLFLFAGRGFSLVVEDSARAGEGAAGWRPSGARLMALGFLALATYWGIVRPGTWFPSAPAAVMALAFLALLATIMAHRRAVAGVATLVALVLGLAAIQEYDRPVPTHYPYALAEFLRQLPGDGPVVLVSRRTATDTGEMEVSSLAFYLRDLYSVSLGVPAEARPAPGPRALYDITGYAQYPARLPASLPADAVLVADREVGPQAIERLQRQFGSRLRLAP